MLLNNSVSGFKNYLKTIFNATLFALVALQTNLHRLGFFGCWCTYMLVFIVSTLLVLVLNFNKINTMTDMSHRDI